MIKILIIDDTDIIRNLLKDFLTESGFHVDIALDGDEGIKKALAEDYHIVFCDVHMPKKNGYQVFTTVRAEKSATTFIMTDSLPDNLAEQTLKAGAYTILTKPFDLDEVRNTINEIIKKEHPVKI